MIFIFIILFSCHIIHIAGQECEIPTRVDRIINYKDLKDGCEEIKGVVIISGLFRSPYSEEEVFE